MEGPCACVSGNDFAVPTAHTDHAALLMLLLLLLLLAPNRPVCITCPQDPNASGIIAQLTLKHPQRLL